MRLFRPFFFARWLFPDALFRIKTNEKVLSLTFDDGPDPESTPVILEILGKHKIKALFFCNGMAAKRYPDVMEQIRSAGHMIGNHGFNHLSGWSTSNGKYLTDIECAATYTSANILRPPYGRIRLKQYQNLKKKYKIVFWDLMPYDFDKSFSSDSVLNVLKKRIRSGSVIVLHDSLHSVTKKVLDEFIKSSLEEGYRFELISGEE